MSRSTHTKRMLIHQLYFALVPFFFRFEWIRASSNPGGVRFGSAELYDVIDTCFAPNATHSSHTIADCLAVGQSILQGTDERVILFIKLLEGEKLGEELEKRIKSEIRTRRSARHVPSKASSPFPLTGYVPSLNPDLFDHLLPRILSSMLTLIHCLWGMADLATYIRCTADHSGGRYSLHAKW